MSNYKNTSSTLGNIRKSRTSQSEDVTTDINNVLHPKNELEILINENKNYIMYIREFKFDIEPKLNQLNNELKKIIMHYLLKSRNYKKTPTGFFGFLIYLARYVLF